MSTATARQCAHALKVIARATGADHARARGRGIAIALPGVWSLTISPDDAGRFRIDVCHSGRVRDTMWCLVGDDARLAELASSAVHETAALAA